MDEWIRALPKAELHIHIEGTLEPEMMFELAARNGVALRYESVEEVRRAYEFSDLQSFLDIYYEGMAVLRTERDFRDLARAYFERAHADGVRHAELFFDPQAHTARGVPLETVVNGLHTAIEEAHSELGISALLILCFLRHLPASEAMATLEEALPFLDRIVGVATGGSTTPPTNGRCARCGRARAAATSTTHGAPPATSTTRRCAPSTPRRRGTRRRTSPRSTNAHAPRACVRSRTPGRKARRPTSGRRSTCSASSASTTACAARRIRRSSSDWSATACRSRCARCRT